MKNKTLWILAAVAVAWWLVSRRSPAPKQANSSPAAPPPPPPAPAPQLGILHSTGQIVDINSAPPFGTWTPLFGPIA